MNGILIQLTSSLFGKITFLTDLVLTAPVEKYMRYLSAYLSGSPWKFQNSHIYFVLHNDSITGFHSVAKTKTISLVTLQAHIA